MRLASDSRGQSVTLGAIIVFAFVISGLGLYQAFIVPDQNAAVEASHEQTIDDDFAEIQAGVQNAAERNGAYTQSIQLGINYPARSLSINPPDPSGSIRTASINGDIGGSVTDPEGDTFTWQEDICGLSTGVDTQAFVYQPNYNELNGVGVHAYENTVTYQYVDEDIASSEQSLVSGKKINFQPLVGGDISRASSESETVTFETGDTGQTRINTSSWTLTAPSRLPATTWEESILADQMATEGPVTAVSPGPDDTVSIQFEAGTYQLQCTPIGLDKEPSNDPNLSRTEDSEDSENRFNPVGEGALELRDASSNGVNLKGRFFWNENSEGPDRTVEAARVAYVVNPGNSGDGQVTINVDDDPDSPDQDLEIGGGKENTSSVEDWTWSPGESRTVVFSGNELNGQNVGLVVILEFDDGSESTYFVSGST